MSNSGLLSGTFRTGPPGTVSAADPTRPSAAAFVPALGQRTNGREYTTSANVVADSVSLWSTQAEFSPFNIGTPCEITKLGLEVTGATANTGCGFGLYSAIGNGGWPSDLIWHSGYNLAIPTDTTGLKWLQLAQPLRMGVGTYFLAIRRNDGEAGAIGLRGCSNGQPIYGEWTLAGAASYMSVSINGPWRPTYQGAMDQSPRPIQIFFRVGV